MKILLSYHFDSDDLSDVMSISHNEEPGSGTRHRPINFHLSQSLAGTIKRNLSESRGYLSQ